MEKKCERPGCNGTLVKLQNESTWTSEKFYCSEPKCGRPCHIATKTGKLAQLAPLASFGLLAVALITLDFEGVLHHGGEAIESCG
jgi:hypothetical protein